jgi:hypothetical protein
MGGSFASDLGERLFRLRHLAGVGRIDLRGQRHNVRVRSRNPWVLFLKDLPSLVPQVSSAHRPSLTQARVSATKVGEWVGRSGMLASARPIGTSLR